MTSEEIEPSEERRALAVRAVTEIATHKTTWADVWAALTRLPEQEEKPDRTPSPVKPLTPVQISALARLPQVYGRVAPGEVRLLEEAEQADVVEEREVIDCLLTLLTDHKNNQIREIIANHLDMLLEQDLAPEVLESLRVDTKGHYQIRQDALAPGTGRKFQKTVSDPKPALTSAGVQQAYEDGAIDRKTYLAITCAPEVQRDLSEERLAQTIKRDPNLLWVLSEYTRRNDPVTTIKIEKDTG